MTDAGIYEPADIVIHIRGKGMVLKEKSLVAYNTTDNKIAAYGSDAEYMEGSAPENIMIMSPLRQGIIAHYLLSVKLFTHLLHKAWGKKPFFKQPIVICVPEGMTEVEKKAVEDAIYQSGAKYVMITTIPADQFVAQIEAAENLPKQFSRCRTIMGITKDNVELYVAEELEQLLQYSKENGISAERMKEFLFTILEDSEKC